MKILSIYDVKAEAFNPPFHALTKGEAIRNFQSACTDPKTTLHQYPEDFTLYELAEFDQNTGSIEKHIQPIELAKATEFKLQ